MNILLSEVQSLTLNLQTSAPVDQTRLEKFSQLFSEKLADFAERESNVFDLKGISINFEQVDLAREMPLTEPLASWIDFLDDEPVKISTQTDMPMMAPVEDSQVVSTELIEMSQLQFSLAQLIPLQGGELPVGGNSLPPESSLDAAAALPDLAPVENTLALQTAIGRNQWPAQPVAPENPRVVERIVENGGLAANRVASQPAFVEKLIPAQLEQSVTRPVAEAKTAAINIDAARVELTAAKNPAAAELTQFIAAAKPASAEPTSPQVRPSPLAPAIETEQLAQAAQKPQLDVAFVRESAPVAELRDLLKSLNPAAPAGVKSIVDRSPVDAIEPPAQVLQNPAPVSNSSHTAVNIPSNLHAASSSATGPGVNPALIPLPTQLATLSLTPVANSVDWGNGLGERVNWMINQKQNLASIRLDPPTLGKLEIQIQLRDDSTSVTILTHQTQTRELIESASYRLRDFLQEAGYQNVNVDVSQRQDQQQARSGNMFHDSSERAGNLGGESGPASSREDSLRYQTGDGLVDTFA